MSRKPYTQGRTFIGRLPKGADLVAAITRVANEEGIRTGTVTVHGSVERAALSVPDQNGGMPLNIERDGGLEIASVSGTISQFKGRSMARLNGVFAAGDGSPIGGLLTIGTVVHACEVVITELEGGTLSRDFDPATGLPLWRDTSLLIEP
jgi:predicted DNA-binding protein with PD1-like motif